MLGGQGNEPTHGPAQPGTPHALSGSDWELGWGQLPLWGGPSPELTAGPAGEGKGSLGSGRSGFICALPAVTIPNRTPAGSSSVPRAAGSTARLGAVRSSCRPWEQLRCSQPRPQPARHGRCCGTRRGSDNPSLPHSEPRRRLPLRDPRRAGQGPGKPCGRHSPPR